MKTERERERQRMYHHEQKSLRRSLAEPVPSTDCRVCREKECVRAKTQYAFPYRTTTSKIITNLGSHF